MRPFAADGQRLLTYEDSPRNAIASPRNAIN